MTAVIFQVIAWPTLGIAILVFGFAPGAALRLIVLFYRRDHPRRRELLGELYAVPRIERPFWVAEQLEVALFEGLRGRFAARRGQRGLGYAAGAALVGVLAALDFVPLYLVALTLGSNSGDTWLITLILLVASVGAMGGFRITRYAAKRGLFAGLVAVAYLGLLALRTSFLVTEIDESLPTALLQATLLIVISSVLLLCGSAVLCRIRPRPTGKSDSPPDVRPGNNAPGRDKQA